MASDRVLGDGRNNCRSKVGNLENRLKWNRQMTTRLLRGCRMIGGGKMLNNHHAILIGMTTASQTR